MRWSEIITFADCPGDLGRHTEGCLRHAVAAQHEARFVHARRDAPRRLFARAIERRELRADVDVDPALDLIFGPLYHRFLYTHAPLNDRFAVARLAALGSPR